MNSELDGAIAALPSTHFGLRWDHAAELDEVTDLVHSCEEQDAIEPRTSPSELALRLARRIHSALLAGRDAAGQLRTVAFVHWVPADLPGTAVLHAYVDPAWRGRGIGRQVLAWQDSVAIAALSDHATGLVGVTIPATLIDRRRLYTAAGFSSRGRVHSYVAVLAAQHLDVAEPTEQIVPLRELPAHLSGDLPRSVVDFVASGMYASDRLAIADPDASHMALRNGAVVGSILVHLTEDSEGESVALINDLRPGSAAAPALLASAYRALREQQIEKAYLRITPESLGTWEDPVRACGGTPSGAHVLYSIEWP